MKYVHLELIVTPEKTRVNNQLDRCVWSWYNEFVFMHNIWRRG